MIVGSHAATAAAATECQTADPRRGRQIAFPPLRRTLPAAVLKAPEGLASHLSSAAPRNAAEGSRGGGRGRRGVV